LNVINSVRSKDPESAGRLAKEIAAKLQDEKLFKSSEAASLALNLLRFVRAPARRDPRATTNLAPADLPPAENEPLLSEQEYRALFQKTVTDALAYNAPATNAYSQERNTVQNLLNSLKSMPSEMEAFAPGNLANIEKKQTELNLARDPQN